MSASSEGDQLNWQGRSDSYEATFDYSDIGLPEHEEYEDEGSDWSASVGGQSNHPPCESGRSWSTTTNRSYSHILAQKAREANASRASPAKPSSTGSTCQQASTTPVDEPDHAAAGPSRTASAQHPLTPEIHQDARADPLHEHMEKLNESKAKDLLVLANSKERRSAELLEESYVTDQQAISLKRGHTQSSQDTEACIEGLVEQGMGLKEQAWALRDEAHGIRRQAEGLKKMKDLQDK